MSHDPSLHPSEGARFLFERESESSDRQRAVYRAAVYTPEQRFDYSAEMLLDGSFTLSASGDAAGDALENKLSVIAKLIARDAAKKRADNMPPWPHRVLRWRGPGRG